MSTVNRLSKSFKYILTIIIGLFIFFRAELIIFGAQILYDTAKNSETEITYKDNEMTITSNVIAIIHGHMYVGYATGYIDGNGILEVTSLDDINIKCLGEYSYTSLELLSGGKVVLEAGDVIRIDCSVADKLSGTLSIMEIT